MAELQTGCAQHFTAVALESDTDESRLMMRRCSVIFDGENPVAQVIYIYFFFLNVYAEHCCRSLRRSLTHCELMAGPELYDLALN